MRKPFDKRPVFVDKKIRDMKKLYTLLSILLLFVGGVNAQTAKLTAKENNTTNYHNIVISKHTYNTLNNPNLNNIKLSKIADKNSPIYGDNPMTRANYELFRLRNPKTGKIPLNIRELEREYVLSNASKLQHQAKAGYLQFAQSGPRNVGGRTRALAIDINDKTGNTILAGGVSGGLWKSTNNGKSWYRVTKSEAHPSITAIAQDPRAGHTNVWYYTTGEFIGNSANACGASYSGNGLFKSVDNGETWTPITNTTSNTTSRFDNHFDYCWAITVNPKNGAVYVATYGAIFVSYNGGRSWKKELANTDKQENSQVSFSKFTDVICTNSGTVYATLSSEGKNNIGIWRKASNNSKWQNITPANFPKTYRRIVLASANLTGSKEIIYLLGNTPKGGFQDHSFWKLTYNNRAKWENRSNNLPTHTGDHYSINGYNSHNSYNMVIKVAPDNENMVFIGGRNLYRSDDAFTTKNNTFWIGGYATENNFIQYKNHHADIHTLVFKPDNKGAVCGHDGGLSITDNYKSKQDKTPNNHTNTPVDWTFINNGYLTTQTYAVAINHDNTKSKTIIAGFQDNGTWYASDANPKTNWLHCSTGDGGHCAIFNGGNSILTSCQNGITYLKHNILNSSDYYWTRIDPINAKGQLFITPYTVDANSNEIVYYAAGSDIWRNTNIFEIPKLKQTKAATNWEKINKKETKGNITCLASSTFPAHILYYGTSKGKIYKINNSNHKNSEVIDITGANMPNMNGGILFVSSIAINPQDANEIVVAFSNYNVESIYHTTNGGKSWTPISGNLEDGNASGNGPSVRSVAILKTPTQTTYFAGTSTGLYSTNQLNGNKTQWQQESINKIGTAIIDMIAVRRDGFIVAGSHGNGVFSTDIAFNSLPPVAIIGITKNRINVGDAVDFKNRTIGDGKMVYKWTFEGAETKTSNQEHPTNIVYNKPGTYNVTLQVTNDAGTDTHTIKSAIVVKEFKADFIADNTYAQKGSTIQFTNLSAGNPTDLKWEFEGGNPKTSIQKNPTVTYNTPGKYTVSLTISGNNGKSTEIKTKYITIIDPKKTVNETLCNISSDNADKLAEFLFTGENSGYISGHSNLDIDMFAEKFTNINPNLNCIKKVLIKPSTLQSNSDNPYITLKIWEGKATPTKEIYTMDVPYSQLKVNEFNTIILPDSVPIKTDFFVGYELNYSTPIDTFAVAQLPLIKGKWKNTAYMHYNGNWSSYTDVFKGELNTALAIKVVVGIDANSVKTITAIDNYIVKQETNNSEIIIYPNPMYDKSKISFPNRNNSKYRLIVVDANGRVTKIVNNITNDNIIINREQLKPGVYIINMAGEKIYKSKLLVK